MVLICCWLCSFAYRLGGFFQVKADTTNSRELSSSSEWSCCDGRARLPVDLPSILVPPMEEIQRTYLFNTCWEYSLVTTKEVWKQSRYLRRVVCMWVVCVCVCARVCVCVWVCVLSQLVVRGRTESMDAVEWPGFKFCNLRLLALCLWF